ncbi:MAG: hypothetical protein MEQ07_11300 [Aquimonas sp.]|nr:hypothetical protein [Aquimonas sp.]
MAEHDDRWLFTLAYVGLTVVLSLLISLFWLVAVVAAHAALEWYALKHRGFPRQRLGRTLWHLKLDVSLILFARALAKRRTPEETPDCPEVPPWRQLWRRGDYGSIGFGAACLLMILLSPWLSGNDFAGVLQALALDLHPWPRTREALI